MLGSRGRGGTPGAEVRAKRGAVCVVGDLEEPQGVAMGSSHAAAKLQLLCLGYPSCLLLQCLETPDAVICASWLRVNHMPHTGSLSNKNKSPQVLPSTTSTLSLLPPLSLPPLRARSCSPAT